MAHSFNKSDRARDAYMLKGKLAIQGYDWWWHSFTAINHNTGEEKAFFIEYFVCNPEAGGIEPVLGQLPINKEIGRCPSYLMVKAGCWGKNARQIHRFFAWDDVKIRQKGDYGIKAGDCLATETRLRGSVKVTKAEAEAHPEYMCDAGTMQWDLSVDKQIAFNVGYGASKALRDINAFEMYWHAEGMKTKYQGSILLDGELYDVMPDSSYGYADKNWGSNFTSPWVWLSSNRIISKKTGQLLQNSAFDIGGGRPKVYFLPINKKLLGAFYYEGEEIEFNFSKFWTKPKTRFRCYETETDVVWKVIQENRDYIMMTDIECAKEEMLLINYEAPDGQKRHNRLFNGGTGSGTIKLYRKTDCGNTLVDEFIVDHVGCEYGEYTE